MIPPELYRNIIGNLDHSHDRKSLLSAALCCVLLRAESQRVLFRSTTGSIWHRVDQLHRHMIFLEAILHAPGRLAWYVREYQQSDIGWEPGFMCETSTDCTDFEDRTKVYEMTRQALPLMTNLKILCFSPFHGSPSTHVLRQCTFQLQALEWWQPGCEGELVSTVFPHQGVLCHIAAVWTSDTRLPTNILPKLASLRGPLLTLIVFIEAMGPGIILTFDHVFGPPPIHRREWAERLTQAFFGIKYLRMPSIYIFEDLLRAIILSDSIALLELTFWDTRHLEFEFRLSLPGNLRVLILRAYNSEPGQRPLSQEDEEQVALTAFMQRPSLRYVEFRPLYSVYGLRVHRPSDLAGELSANTVTFVEHETDWWMGHSMEID